MFRGYGPGPSRNGMAAFQVVWRYDRRFDIKLDTRRGTLHCPLVLPQVPAGSAMYRRLREFLKACHDPALPEHRRIDSGKVQVACANRGGSVSLSMTICGGDYEYATRKFIHLIQEIYLVFLVEYFEYQVEVFDLDPDHP